jgi:hypothetical protein
MSSHAVDVQGHTGLGRDDLRGIIRGTLHCLRVWKASEDVSALIGTVACHWMTPEPSAGAALRR